VHKSQNLVIKELAWRDGVILVDIMFSSAKVVGCVLSGNSWWSAGCFLNRVSSYVTLVDCGGLHSGSRKVIDGLIG